MRESPSFDLMGKKIWVAGHRGMLGSAIVRRLEREGCDILTASRADVDLTDQAMVRTWLGDHRPDAIFMAAAKVGGILANDSLPADFLYENLMIEANVLEGAHRAGTAKVLMLGSSCIYPKFADQPIVEDAMLTGPLEPTNQWYAIAKIAGLKLAEAYRLQHGRDFISAMPTNLYGPGDNFDLNTSHVMPALIRKAHEAKLSGARELVIWGTGSPRREFLHVDDCADACVYLMRDYSDAQHINVGSGEDIAIIDLARLIANVVGYKGGIVCDITKPDGTARKLMSSARLRERNWAPSIELADGIRSTYDWYLEHHA